jgi:hypothetical protein
MAPAAPPLRPRPTALPALAPPAAPPLLLLLLLLLAGGTTAQPTFAAGNLLLLQVAADSTTAAMACALTVAELSAASAPALAATGASLSLPSTTAGALVTLPSQFGDLCAVGAPCTGGSSLSSDGLYTVIAGYNKAAAATIAKPPAAALARVLALVDGNGAVTIANFATAVAELRGAYYLATVGVYFALSTGASAGGQVWLAPWPSGPGSALGAPVQVAAAAATAAVNQALVYNGVLLWVVNNAGLAYCSAATPLPTAAGACAAPVVLAGAGCVDCRAAAITTPSGASSTTLVWLIDAGATGKRSGSLLVGRPGPRARSCLAAQ